MATYLETVNKVLKRLREDQVVTSTETEYSALIGDFVADAYHEVWLEHNWESLKHRVVVDLSTTETKYDLSRTVTDGGDLRDGTSRVIKSDSELSWIMDPDVEHRPEFYLYDSDSDPHGNAIRWLNPDTFRLRQAISRDQTTERPVEFTLFPELDTDTVRMYLEIWPQPNIVQVAEMVFWTEPDEIVQDDSDDATVLLVPDRLVYLLALMYAYNERGEEIGEPGNLAERRYINALGAAKQQDIGMFKRGDRYDWKPD